MNHPMSDATTAAVQAILEADDARYAAMIRADIPALERMLAEELLYCHSSGQVDTHTSYLAALRSGAVQYLEARRFDELVNVIGPVAVMCGTHQLRVLVGGQERMLNNRFTTTWLLQAGRWRLLSWASIPVPAPAAV